MIKIQNSEAQFIEIKDDNLNIVTKQPESELRKPVETLKSEIHLPDIVNNVKI